MRKIGFKTAGDNLLFALALAVLISGVFTSLVRRAGEAAIPSLVFTQWWQDDLRDGSLERLVAEFQSQHPEIRIILRQKSYEDLRRELFTPADPELAGAAPADIVALDPLWVSGLLAREVIESAESPILSFINVLYYNIDILREAGFIRPPRTRSEFLTFARTLAAGGESAALVLALGEDSFRGIHDTVYPWIWAAGAQLLPDGNPALTSPAIVQSLAFFASLSQEGLIAPGAFAADSSQALEAFISGRTAFMVASTRYIALVRERMGEDAFNITTIPIPDNLAGTQFLASLGWTVGVHSQSAHKEQARLFAAFLAGRAPFLAENARGAVPAAPVVDPFYSRIWEIALTGETAGDFSGIIKEPELEGIFREELPALFAGELTPAQTAAAIQGRWLDVLQEAY